MKKLYIVGTFDTKAAELIYAGEMSRQAGVDVVLVDVSTREAFSNADVSAAEVASYHPQGATAVLGQSDRGRAVTAMAQALATFLLEREDVGGVLGLGGSGNTALVTHAMRQLPIGIPKLMLSTVGSSNVAPYVGSNDIAMMYSVVDIAGLNVISRKVIGNAAHAAAGMVAHSVPSPAVNKPAIGMTMFGVTTDCVSAVRARLEGKFDTTVFHATGVGSQSMEMLAESGFLVGMLDITTTEVADFLVGGVCACTNDRFGAAIRTRVPYVGSVGACDIVNFGVMEAVPMSFRRRNLHAHNAQVTLMRTTAEENAAIGAFIVERINQMEGPVRFLLPLGGVSAIDAPGMPFYDPQADAALFEAIRIGWKSSANRRLIEVTAHINAPTFAAALARSFLEITR